MAQRDRWKPWPATWLLGGDRRRMNPRDAPGGRRIRPERRRETANASSTFVQCGRRGSISESPFVPATTRNIRDEPHRHRGRSTQAARRSPTRAWLTKLLDRGWLGMPGPRQDGVHHPTMRALSAGPASRRSVVAVVMSRRSMSRGRRLRRPPDLRASAAGCGARPLVESTATNRTSMYLGTIAINCIWFRLRSPIESTGADAPPDIGLNQRADDRTARQETFRRDAGGQPWSARLPARLVA